MHTKLLQGSGKARVNIKVAINNQQTTKKTELPLSLLILGNFSGQTSKVLQNQRPKTVNLTNLPSVLAEMKPRLQFDVPNYLQGHEGKLPLDLTFSQLADFTPDNLLQNIPVLRRVLAMRNLLSDLKSLLLDKTSLEKALSEIKK